ncbi:MAG: dihydroorotate dehydrogenase electron transfer subunit, partial [Bacteroidales bacterium]|nr:dihydroorotate dehydrogenase electron transfer subunit [Bacteroidales bacterium]
GTKVLSSLQSGDKLNILYPLGNSFTTKDVKRPLLIGGGCGIAPLLFLAKSFVQNNIEPTVLAGAQTAAALSWTANYDNRIHIRPITDDGSLGETGLITEHSLLKDLSRFDRMYTCGPEIMMKAIAKLADRNNIPCEVSLENTMACGIGACLCCVTETVQGNRCVCTDGPIFDIHDLKSFI